MVTYVIQKNDTLSGIAYRYGVTVESIKKTNPTIKDVNKIKEGQKISIPVNVSANYNDIGKQVVKCLEEIETLSSVKTLLAMIGE